MFLDTANFRFVSESVFGHCMPVVFCSWSWCWPEWPHWGHGTGLQWPGLASRHSIWRARTVATLPWIFSPRSQGIPRLWTNMLQNMLCFQKQLNHEMQLIESIERSGFHATSLKIPCPLECRVCTGLCKFRQTPCPRKEALKRGLPCGGGDKRLWEEFRKKQKPWSLAKK